MFGNALNPHSQARVLSTISIPLFILDSGNIIANRYREIVSLSVQTSQEEWL